MSAEPQSFRPLGIAVVAVSDTRTVDTDTSGKVLEELAVAAGHTLLTRVVVQDERALIAARVRHLGAIANLDVILLTGGTGLTHRDVTPEAVEGVCDRMIPGFGELFRQLSFEALGTATLLSRACAGIMNGRLVFAIPGSPGACRDAWNKILVHQLDARTKPCSLAALLPQIRSQDKPSDSG